MRNRRSEAGTALVEAAVTIPLLLLISVGIFEFGRAYQTWQVITNAAREGARIAVLPSSTQTAVQQRVQEYMRDGQLSRWSTATVAVDGGATITVNGAAVPASRVTVNYPFAFIVLQPIARLVAGGQTTLGASIPMTAQALMRNE